MRYGDRTLAAEGRDFWSIIIWDSFSCSISGGFFVSRGGVWCIMKGLFFVVSEREILECNVRFGLL